MTVDRVVHCSCSVFRFWSHPRFSRAFATAHPPLLSGSASSMQYFPDNKTSNFVTKLSRTLQLDGEWEVGPAKIDYPHTWYNIREGKNSVEIYAPDKWFQVFNTVEYSIQPGYYEKVQDVIDALFKAGLANITDVVVTYDDTSKRAL